MSSTDNPLHAFGFFSNSIFNDLYTFTFSSKYCAYLRTNAELCCPVEQTIVSTFVCFQPTSQQTIWRCVVLETIQIEWFWLIFKLVNEPCVAVAQQSMGGHQRFEHDVPIRILQTQRNCTNHIRHRDAAIIGHQHESYAKLDEIFTSQPRTLEKAKIDAQQN